MSAPARSGPGHISSIPCVTPTPWDRKALTFGTLKPISGGPRVQAFVVVPDVHG